MGQEHLELFVDKEIPKEVHSVTLSLEDWNRKAAHATLKVRLAISLVIVLTRRIPITYFVVTGQVPITPKRKITPWKNMSKSISK